MMRGRCLRKRRFRSPPLCIRESKPGASWRIVACRLRTSFVLQRAGICIRPDRISNKNLIKEKSNE